MLERLLEALGLYGPTLRVIVEMISKDGGETRAKAFDAYAIDSVYNWRTYILRHMVAKGNS